MDLFKLFRINVERHELWLVAAFFLMLVVTYLVYQPALKGPFLLDDFDNLLVMENQVTDFDSLKSYLATGNAGPLGRPISKLSFLLDDNAWPSYPDNFKRTNLLIHLLIGVLVFFTFRLMLSFVWGRQSADWVALFVAAAFLLHPLQMSTAMYVVQRMTQLAGLFVIFGVGMHVYWRSKFLSIGYRELLIMTASLGFFGLLAIFSKESGVLLPVFVWVVELTLLSAATSSRLFQKWKVLCLIVPTVMLAAYLSYLPRWLGSYATRDFTLSERLLTEPVILIDYLRAILSMRVSGLGLFHDDFPVYSSVLNLKPLFSILVLLLSAGWAVIYRRRYPVVSFGVLWFLAGHMLESTTLSLEMYFEHRNYIPMLGPVLSAVYLLHCILKRVSMDLARLGPIFAVLLLSLMSASTLGYATEWASLKRLIPVWAAEHPDSPRAQRAYAHVLALSKMPVEALDVLDRAYEKFPYDLSIPVVSMDIACFFNLPTRYSLDELAGKVENHRVTDGLRVAVTQYGKSILKTSCRERTDEFHRLLARLPAIQLAGSQPSLIAIFSLVSGDLYFDEKRWNLALKSYEQVEFLKPTVDSASRLYAFYLYVQDYQPAREFLELAKDRNDLRSGLSYKTQEEEFSEQFKMLDWLENRAAIAK